MSAARALLLAAAAMLPAGAATAADAHGVSVVERRVAVMGTTLAVSVEAADRAGGLAASEAAVAAVEAAEARLSTWREDSELARLNRAPAGAPFPLSPALAADLRDALACARATGGAFDPTVGPLVAAWDLRGRGRVPAADELARAVAATGFAGLELSGTAAVRRRPGLTIEEGGWGKGAALRDALAALDRASGETGASRALLDLGGQVAVWSATGARAARTIEIADPHRRDRPVVALAIDRGSLATSGNSERAIEVGGRRYGHLLDPRTGRPAPDFGSLTVWAADPLAADCLSKLYVLGPERALAWAAAHPGFDVLALAPEAGGRIAAKASRGLAGRLTALVPEVEEDEAGAAPPPPPESAAPEPSAARLDRLEKEVAALKAELARLAGAGQGGAGDKERLAEIERRLDVLAQEIERLRLGEEVAGATAPERGMGPAASKIYRTGRGVSIGGYGELLYDRQQDPQEDGARAHLDLLRGVVYVGYKWTDRWLLNSELEWEHANTEKGGEAAVEFAYVDYRFRPAFSFRGGLLLMPVGFLNELHEPTTFLGARRPDVEDLLIPTTWRESGVGLYGESGPFTYRAYVTGGLDATGFSGREGLAEGSAEGANAKADDLAGVARLDWTARPGLVAGFSLYHGGAGQGLATDEGRRLHVATTLAEAHAEWRYRGIEARAIGVRVSIADVAALDRALGLTGRESIGSRLEGGYLQLGYDLFSLFPHGEQSLVPFARYERTNTQAAVPAGFDANPANDVRSWTLGLSYKPIPQVVLKADYQSYDNRAGTGQDRVNLALGWIF